MNPQLVAAAEELVELVVLEEVAGLVVLEDEAPVVVLPLHNKAPLLESLHLPELVAAVLRHRLQALRPLEEGAAVAVAEAQPCRVCRSSSHLTIASRPTI